MNKQELNKLFHARDRAKKDWLYWHRQIGGAAWAKEDKTEAKQILATSREAYKKLLEIEQKIRDA